MDVVHVDFGGDWRGGQQQLLLLARELRARGWRQTVVTPRPELAARWRELGFAALPPRWAAARRVRGASVGHAHDGRALGWLLAAATGGRGPARVASRRVAFRLNAVGAWKYRRADRILAVSAHVRGQLLAAGAREERVVVVPDGVDRADIPEPSAARARARAALGLSAASRCIACVSALSEEKGVGDLIAALTELPPDILLLLGGEGPLREELGRRARALGVAERVRFTAGAGVSLPELAAAGDVFALPSRREGLGSSLLMAMALGRPAVATATGGIPELVADETTGLLAPAGEPKALAAVLARVLARPELGARLAATAAARLDERFSAASVATATLEAYAAARRERGASGSERKASAPERGASS